MAADGILSRIAVKEFDMANQKDSSVKKPNIFVRMGKKLKETFSELKRVTWPTFPKVVKNTCVVLVVVLVFTVVITGINVGLQALLDLITGLGA